MSYVEHFEFSAAAKKKLIIAIVVGAILLAIGILGLSSDSTLFDPSLASGHEDHSGGVSNTELLADHNHDAHADHITHSDEGHGHDAHSEGHEYSWTKRLKAVLWHATVYVLGVSLIGLFFYCIQLVTWAGWSVLLKRVFLAMSSFVPYAGVVLLLLYIAFNHDLFHWTHENLYDKSSEMYDKIIDGKSWYLGVKFVFVRAVIYIGGWSLFGFFLTNQAKLQDETGNILHHNRAINLAGGFLVFFGVSSSMSSWDWIMSIDTHWFSTMFGWYVFASMFVSGLALMTLIIIELKKAGYLEKVNENHIHDMGKFVFAFSIFWTYIWFSQFILYWYANVPEEVVWFNERLFYNNGVYAPMFYINLIVNFLFPFFFLMTRDAKRQAVWLKVACVAILIGHWVDTYLMIMPGIIGKHGGLNFGTIFLEGGVALIYIGVFGYVVLRSLSKLPLIAKNDPMLEESINFHQ